MTNPTPTVLGTVVLSNGSVAALAGNQTKEVTSSSFTYFGFDQLQVAILAPGTATSLNQSTGLSFPAGGSPNNQFNPSGGGAIAALTGGGMAVLTWGDPNNAYYLQLLDNSGGVTTSAVQVASGGSSANNVFGYVGAYSGGVDVAYVQNDEAVFKYQRYSTTGNANGTALTLSPGTGPTDPDGTPTYTLGGMTVDPAGDVLFSFRSSDVYTQSKYIEYDSSGAVVASGSAGSYDGASAWVALSGGGFATVGYTPTGAWNNAYPGFDLVVQKLTAGGALSTLFSATATGLSGYPVSVASLAIDSNGVLYFEEATSGSNHATAYSTFDTGTSVLTHGVDNPSANLPFATAPSGDSSGQVLGAGVNASNQLVQETLACFAAGTSILTVRGEVPVETLRAGDEVRLARDGQTAPIVWIGHRRVDAGAGKLPAGTSPVRIRAGALGVGVPRRDLFVSPEHAMWLDGVLVPARWLVNGASIVQQAVDAVSYFHIELARHDVVLAEGAPAESWLDTGNRDMFENAGGANAHRRAPPASVSDAWAERGCGELVEDGPRLAALRERLARRAAAIGMPIPPSFSISVGKCGRFEAAVPAEAALVRLISAGHVPPGEARRLGAAVMTMAIDGQPLPLDDQRLGKGFHGTEIESGLSWRWTDGEAVLELGAALEARLLSFEVRALAGTGAGWANG